MLGWLIRCLLLLWHIYTGLSDLGSGDEETFEFRLYPHGPMQNDKKVPNTEEYVGKCFQLNITKDELNFRGNNFNKLFICRNGMVRFKNDEFQHLPLNFGLHPGQKDDPVITPYWSRANTNESFLEGNSHVYYHIYTNRSSSDKLILLQTEEHIQNLFPSENILNVDLVIVITWRCLQPENRIDLENTFQLVLIVKDCSLFSIFNYGTIEWSVPAPRSQISLWADYVGKPVLGWNAGQIGINHEFFNIKNFSGTLNADLIEDSTGTLGIGQFMFSIGGCTQQASERLCLLWQASQPTVSQSSLNSSFTCPCTLAQIQNDIRFYKENIITQYNKTCYLFNFHINSHGQRCCYSSLGSLITDLPHAGSALRFHPKYFPTEYYQNDESGYQYCCEQSDLCKAYFERREIGNCTNYTAPNMGLTFGDPHFRTFDGETYTFNGVGEFILTTSPVFEVQIRTQLVGDTREVAVRAVVAWEKNCPSILLSIDNTESFLVEVNGTLFGNLEDLTDIPTVIQECIAISRPSKDYILVIYPLGNSIKVTKVINSLSVIVASTTRLKDKQKGLLGLLNGDRKDEYTLKDGSRLNSTELDDEQIHYKFGLNWQIVSDESLFNYKNGTNVSTFSLQDIVPIFSKSFSLQQRNAANILCDGDKCCMYDYITRNSSEIALLTLKTSRSFNKSLIDLKNMPPKINFPQELYLNLGEIFLFDITAEDDGVKPILLSVSGLPGLENIQTLTGALYFNWTVNTIEEFQILMVATDSNKATTILKPTIKICACQNGGECFQDLNGLGKSYQFHEFYVMNCSCPQNVNGRLCENNPADLCPEGSGPPCFPGLECQSTKYGIKCGACPSGYAGDGITCQDINECHDDNGGCDQICENTPGSYHCRCKSKFNKGYKLENNGKTCEDIDECVTNASDCQQKCDNTEGSFTCSCYENFKIDPNNPKQCISATPCPRINKCRQQCHKSEDQEICSCDVGYRLQSDGINCIDINECIVYSSGCHHSCENSQGSFKCSCLPGYQLEIDGKTCQDYDECTESLGNCDATRGQRCVNLIGEFKCECDRKLGFFKINGTCQGISGKNVLKEVLDKAHALPKHGNKTSVRVLIKNQKLSQWKLDIHTAFRQVIAKAVTDYCSGGFEEKLDCGVEQYGKVDFNELHVNRLPGYPKQEGKDLEIFFYVFYPRGIKLKMRENASGLSKFTLQRILKEYKQFIENALNLKLDVAESRDEDFYEEPQSSNSRSSSNKALVISLSVTGALFLIAITSGLIIWRIKARNRNQDQPLPPSINIDDFDAILPDVPPLY